MRAGPRKSSPRVRSAASLLLALGLVASPGCTLAPDGTQREFDVHAEVGRAYDAPRAERVQAPLPEDPTPDELVAFALLARADLEADWQAWRAALQGVLVASGWPNTDLSLSLSRMVMGGSAWDTTTVMLGFDPMEMLLLPGKVRQAGRVAFERALAAGCAFEQRRLDVRSEVLVAAADWARLGVRLDLARQDVALLDSLERSARAAVAAGARQDELLAVQLEAARARATFIELEESEPALRATLNARLGRRYDAPLRLPREQPAPRPLPADELWQLAAHAGFSLRLQGLTHETLALAEQYGLARLRRWPDVAPFVQATGSGPEEIGVMIALPVHVPAVRAAARQARAERDAAALRLAQERLDEQALFHGTLAALRGDERTLELLRRELEPATRALESTLAVGYANGMRSFAELVDVRRALLEVRALTADVLAARERRLAELERLGVLDLTRLLAAQDSESHALPETHETHTAFARQEAP